MFYTKSLEERFAGKVVKNVEEIDFGDFSVEAGTEWKVEGEHQGDLLLEPVSEEVKKLLESKIGADNGLIQVDPDNEGSEFYLKLEIVE